jgi:hypothetical protein
VRLLTPEFSRLFHRGTRWTADDDNCLCAPFGAWLARTIEAGRTARQMINRHIKVLKTMARALAPQPRDPANAPFGAA